MYRKYLKPFILIATLFIILIIFINACREFNKGYDSKFGTIYETKEIAYKKMLEENSSEESKIISKFEENENSYYVIATDLKEEIRFSVVKIFKAKKRFLLFPKEGYVFTKRDFAIDSKNEFSGVGFSLNKNEFITLWIDEKNDKSKEPFAYNLYEKVREIHNDLIEYKGMLLSFSIYEVKEK